MCITVLLTASFHAFLSGCMSLGNVGRRKLFGKLWQTDIESCKLLNLDDLFSDKASRLFFYAMPLACGIYCLLAPWLKSLGHDAAGRPPILGHVLKGDI
jgi:hypothetical protein